MLRTEFLIKFNQATCTSGQLKGCVEKSPDSWSHAKFSFFGWRKQKAICYENLAVYQMSLVSFNATLQEFQRERRLLNINYLFLQGSPFNSKAGIHRGPVYQGIDVYSYEVIKKNKEVPFDQDLGSWNTKLYMWVSCWEWLCLYVISPVKDQTGQLRFFAWPTSVPKDLHVRCTAQHYKENAFLQNLYWCFFQSWILKGNAF